MKKLFFVSLMVILAIGLILSGCTKKTTTIDQEREMRLKRWEAVRQTIDRDELSQKAKQEQSGKMEDLL